MPPPYRNPSGIDVSAAGLARWTFDRMRRRLPRPPSAPIRGVSPDVEYLRANRTDTTITWIGHASLLLQLAGRNILIDPVFSRRVSPVAFAGPRVWMARMIRYTA